jgi:ABC-type polysaccharide/polyol phosphate export permease
LIGILNKLALVALVDVARQRLGLIVYLARMEFSRRYSATAGGALWMFAGPLLTILAIWLALEFGLGASGRFGETFGANFVVGLAAWLFFADAIQSATSSISSNPHLVKKVVFPVWVLPLASSLAAFFVHVIVLIVTISLLGLVGIPLRFNPSALLTWMALLFVLVAAIGLLLATYTVPVRDVAVLTPNIISLLFWLTPIIWPIKQLSAGFRMFAYANPMAIILEGYRVALCPGTDAPAGAPLAIFLCILSGLLLLTVMTYRRLRPNFADAL